MESRIKLYHGVLRSKILTSNEKAVLCMIASYEGEYLSNIFIGKSLGLTPNCISKILARLKKGEYITTSYEEYNFAKKRMIHATEKTINMINLGGNYNEQSK